MIFSVSFLGKPSYRIGWNLPKLVSVAQNLRDRPQNSDRSISKSTELNNETIHNLSACEYNLSCAKERK